MRKPQMNRWLLAALLSALIVASLVLALASGAAQRRGLSAATSASTLSDICTTGPTFNLKTADGFTSTPDGNSIYMWGYALSAGSFQLPGPVLCVNQGQSVTVNLTNNLTEPVSIVFPGQIGVSASGGSAGLLTREAAASGGTVSYTFTASEPGTYLYESGTDPQKQVQMGLYGALIVRPTMGANFAYNNAATRFDPSREYVLVMNEIDSEVHQDVQANQPFDPTKLHFTYFTINGREFPDTVSGNNVPWLPSQPYGSLVQIQPYNATTNPYPALVRYANAGLANHPFHPHGNHLRVIARDGRLLRGPGGQDTSFENFTRTVGSGQTYDLTVKWTDVEAWSSTGNPIPVTFPGLQNLVFKDGVTFYSGNPYLGQKGTFPAGVTSFNQCGEFYFPWHSHALNEFTNFDEGFGGLATLFRVDPPGGCP